eukprot:14759304-Alexandrium_andersonii.AAC.1
MRRAASEQALAEDLEMARTALQLQTDRQLAERLEDPRPKLVLSACKFTAAQKAAIEELWQGDSFAGPAVAALRHSA